MFDKSVWHTVSTFSISKHLPSAACFVHRLLAPLVILQVLTAALAIYLTTSSDIWPVIGEGKRQTNKQLRPKEKGPRRQLTTIQCNSYGPESIMAEARGEVARSLSGHLTATNSIKRLPSILCCTARWEGMLTLFKLPRYDSQIRLQEQLQMGKLVRKSIRCDCRQRREGRGRLPPLLSSLPQWVIRWRWPVVAKRRYPRAMQNMRVPLRTDAHIPLVLTFAGRQGVLNSASFHLTMSPSIPVVPDVRAQCNNDETTGERTANQRLRSVSPVEKLIDDSTCAKLSPLRHPITDTHCASHCAPAMADSGASCRCNMSYPRCVHNREN